MERKIILATRGDFAAGVQASLALICGETKNVECLCTHMEQPYDLAKMVEDILRNDQQNELIVITDLFSRSASNGFPDYMEERAMYLISGLNLVTLTEIYTQINTVDSLVGLVKRAVENRQGSLCHCNELSNKEILEREFWKEMK